MSTRNFFKEKIDQAKDDQTVFIFQQQTMTYGELKKTIKLFEEHSRLHPGQPVLINLPMGLDQAITITAFLYYNIPGLVLPNGMKPHEINKVKENFPFVYLVEELGVVKKLKEGGDVNFSWMLYTSGSTGSPKIVKISADNLMARTLGEVSLFHIKQNSKILNLLPFSHDLGLNQLLTTLATQSSLEILINKLPMEFAKKISVGVHDGFTGMPQIWNNFIQIAEKTNLKINYKGYITVSGGSMSEENLRKLKHLFPESKIYKTYGQTETFRTFAETRQDKIEKNLCGKPIDGVSVHFRNVEWQIGELIHSGHGVMDGYWMRDEQTSSIATGDYFKLLPDHEYQYIGRKDDMVKHASRRFFLGEIETVIMKSGLVRDVCVVQAIDDRLIMGNEKLVAFVVGQDQPNLGKEIRAYCAGELENFKVPDEYIICEKFPLTTSQKVDRLELMRLHHIKKKEGVGFDL